MTRKKSKLAVCIILLLAIVFSMAATTFADNAIGVNNGKVFQPYVITSNAYQTYLKTSAGETIVDKTNDLWVWASDADQSPANAFNNDYTKFSPVYCLDRGTSLGWANRVYTSPREMIDQLLEGNSNRDKILYVVTNAEEIAKGYLAASDLYASRNMKGYTADNVNYRVFRTATQFAVWNLASGEEPVIDETKVLNPLSNDKNDFLSGEDRTKELEVLRKIEELYEILLKAADENPYIAIPDLTLTLSGGQAEVIENSNENYYYYGPIKAETQQEFDASKLNKVFLKCANDKISLVDDKFNALPTAVKYGKQDAGNEGANLLPYVAAGESFYIKVPNSIPSDNLSGIRVDGIVRADEACVSKNPIIFAGEIKASASDLPADFTNGDLHYKAAQMTVGVVNEEVDVYAEAFYTVASCTLAGTKSILGEVELKEMAGKFTFSIKDKQGAVVATGTNDIAGKIQFSTIKFEKTGTYQYTISEDAFGEENWVADTAVIELQITVAEDSVGALYVDANNKLPEIKFTNKYEEPEDPKKPKKPEETAPKTGDGMAVTLSVIAVFVLAGTTLVVMLKKKRSV